MNPNYVSHRFTTTGISFDFREGAMRGLKKSTNKIQLKLSEAHRVSAHYFLH